MSARESLRRLVDELPEKELAIAVRLLEGLLVTADPLIHKLLAAPLDDEPDNDDLDGGLTAARQELDAGEVVSHEELKRELGLV